MRIKYYLLFLLCLALPHGANAAHASGAMVAIDTGRGKEIVTLDVPKTAGYKVFLVPDPDRLVVDVPSIPGRQHLSLPRSYRGEFIKALRFGQFDPKTSRFVFDLTRPVRISDAGVAHGHLVVTIAPQAEPIAAAKEAQGETPSFPTPPTAGKGQVAQALPQELPFHYAEPPAQEAQSTPSRHHHRKEKKQALLTTRKITGKPMVVIDAGHGGVDPGTIGPDGTYEKDVTLSYARLLRAKLLKTGRYRVRLTRDSDTFIMLRQRVAIARADGANLFISLHADSAPAAVKGLSIYTVSERASDKETAALANRENKADVLAGVNLSDERGDVASILISLAERDTMNRSATLADELVTSLDDRVRLLQNAHRFAGFAVLKAPDIPSVLIEIGFLSSEEHTLTSRTYRDQVTSGIVAGVDAYFAEQKRMGNL